MGGAGTTAAYGSPVQQLVVIAGPIGAGKSTVAALVGQRVAAAGLTAAVVDLDDVAFMQRGVTAHGLWERAGVATAALVRGWMDAGTDVVVAHGPFFEARGYELLLRALPAGVVVHHVLLHVSVETALARVSGDAGRGASKDPDFLEATHVRFRALEPSLPHPDLVFDTESSKAAEIAEGVTASLGLTRRD